MSPIFNRMRRDNRDNTHEHKHESSSSSDRTKRYVHSPLTIEHNGIHASIKENGKVIISKVVESFEDSNPNGEAIEYDEIEVPASLIFKLANLLRNTRQIKYVKTSDIRDL